MRTLSLASVALLALGACHGSHARPPATGGAGRDAGAGQTGAAGDGVGSAGRGPAGASGTTGAAGVGADAGAGTSGAAGVALDGGAEDATPPCTGPTCTACGFIMPNPASTGLPNPASYEASADNTTVTDEVTGLVWESTLSCAAITQAQAAAYCAGRGAGWRLPTRLELRSIVDHTRPTPPKIDPIFRNAPAELFWSAGPIPRVVSFYTGTTMAPPGNARARCVREAARRCFESRFELRAGGLVFDRITALTWEQKVDPASRGWDAATTYCAGLGAGWRLPSVGELETLLDDTRAASATGTMIIDPAVFPDTPRAIFWTSSRNGVQLWVVDMAQGLDNASSNPTLQNRVRCVRGGTPAAPRAVDAGAGDGATPGIPAPPPPPTAECLGHVAGDLVCTGAQLRRCAPDLATAQVVQTCAGQTPLCVGVACVACADPARCQCGAFPMPNAAGGALPNKPSYTTNQDGTVTDNVTGLIWERAVSATGGPKATGSVADCSTNFTPAAAAAYCAGKGSTWRLPTRIELISLVDYTVGQPGPAINMTAFPDTPATGFWSSTPYARNPAGESWAFHFLTVQAYYTETTPTGTRNGDNRVRCVKSGATRCYPQRFGDHPDAGTVSDYATGLTWQTFGPAGELDWAQANAKCAAAGAGWRLPTVSEALSLVDDTRVDPAIDTKFFPGPYFSPDHPEGRPNEIWTSTLVPGDSIGEKWLVDFSDGMSYGGDPTLKHSARCVK